ncbi:hypothetical protein [Streptomyces sp. NPDC008137]|uniref:hypothetical protein n=1 Tax=Streptomyces sp. NPDC008137 TaxID=3364813 RepID=UPI0036E7785E
MNDAFDIDNLRQQAREQLSRRIPPRTAWIQQFETALRALLDPRADLFLAIMSAAGDPGLDDPQDESGLERGWIIGYVHAPQAGVDAACLTLSPGPVRFQTVPYGDLTTQSTALARTVPQETVITSGEVERAGALGEVARYLHDHAHTPRPGPQESAEEYARQCDQRMLALLCANELTFPDRDLSEVVWNDYEAVIISRQDQRRREERRIPMTVEQFARWMEGTFDEPGFVVPSLTGTEFARALALTSIQPERRMRRNWRRQLVDDGEKGWRIGDRSTTDETRSTTILTYIRRDGTGFQETTSLYYGSSTTTTIEYDPDRVYEPAVYSSYLTTRLYYTQRDRT